MTDAFKEADVSKVAHLARIAISEHEQHSLANDMKNILQLVEQLATIDTSDIEPLAHPLDATQPLRPDEVTEPCPRDELQKDAITEAGLYLVPKVIE